MENLQEMKQVSVSELLMKHSLVIPEIQREYVWGKNDYGILDTFLEDIKKGFNNVPIENPVSISVKKILEKAALEEVEAIKLLLEKANEANLLNNFMNIGFLYSYKPNYYVSDEGKDAYLIDGQQRFTSIFLLLFYLAIKENKLVEFRQLYRVKVTESKIAFDYRVRSLTHNFIIDLISSIDNIENLLSIKESCWFLSNYNKDSTITAIVGNEEYEGAFYIIHKHLKDQPDGYFDFVRNNIKFWHFKTEETSQGEELYITMNSRGQQLADNETIRAILFKSEDAKNNPIKWSRLWEEWQDLFWKNRKTNDSSADKGFNEFLTCISGLENYIENQGRIYLKEDFDRFKQISVSDVLRNLSLPKIEKYINCLIYITREEEGFRKQYNYSAWVDNCKESIWALFNTDSTNWFADITDSDRATELNRMVFLWSILGYYKNIGDVDREEFFRVLRLYYIRYNNFDRSVSTMFNTISEIINNGLYQSLSLTNEEQLKHSFMKSQIDFKMALEFEALIWEIEDHKFNLIGRDVGGVNICYLVDFKDINSISDLMLVKQTLYQIFPEGLKEYQEVQNILLYYGEYWHKASPWYYNNFKFDNWRRIIRDRDMDNKPTRNVFSKFFHEFKLFDGNLAEFLSKKRIPLLQIEDCNNLTSKLCWYNQFIGDKMWEQGNYIAISIDGYNNALPNYKGQDKIFNESKILYNTKGNLKGGQPQKLYNLLPKHIKQQ